MTQLFAKKKVEIKDEEAEDFRLKLKNVGEEVHREVIGLETSIEALLVDLVLGAAPGRAFKSLRQVALAASVIVQIDGQAERSVAVGDGASGVIVDERLVAAHVKLE